MRFLSWIKKVVNSRLFVLSICFIIELLFIIIPAIILTNSFWIIYISTVLNIFFVIYIVNKRKSQNFKLAWIVVLCVFPFVGFVLYLLFADKRIPRKLIGYSEEIEENRNKYIKNQTYDVSKIKNANIRKQFLYTSNYSSYPCFSGSKCTYFSSGALFFEDFIKKIREAKHYIFIEFFIVKHGYMLTTLIEELKKKTKEGVKVYMMMDDLGCLPYDSSSTIKELEAIGVTVALFSKVTFPTIFKTSYRDHRKIIVIDNKYAYTGGVNLADEYIGRAFPFGEWKDSAVLFKGKVVSSYTLMFIQFFNFFSKIKLDPSEFIIKNKPVISNSLVLPFSDSPTDDDRTGKNVQLNMINSSEKYIFICTPYLIIDDIFEDALTIKAKTGIRVCILVPGIPDKKAVFMATRSHYETLIKNGVEVYEYTPGFVHSKMIISDDLIALEGSINLDFRSHYLQFESGVLIANDRCLKDMKKDYLDTLKVSKRITMEDIKNVSFVTKVSRAIVNLFSPLF